MNQLRHWRGRSIGVGRMAIVLEIAASIALFCAGMARLEPLVGKPARLLCMPLIVYWGIRRGMMSGVGAAIVAVAVLVPLVTLGAGFAPSPPGETAFILCILAAIGAMIGGVGDLSRRLRRELSARGLAEARLREEQEAFRVFFENNPHPMWIFDLEALQFQAVNRAMADLYGYPVEELARMNLADIQTPENGLILRAAVDGADPKIGHDRPFEWRHRHRDGSIIEVEVVSQRIMYRGKPSRVALATDITDLKRRRAELEYEANHDALTGLPNRASFDRSLDRTIEEAGKVPAPFSLFLMDLDRFKEINDTLGHAYGDLVLREIGPRLRGMLRQGDILARLGGDEFAVLLPGADAAQAERIAARLLATFAEPFILEGRAFDVGVSIGIATHPDHGQDAAVLVQAADEAMYAAKRDRAGIVRFGAARDPANRPILKAAEGVEDGGMILPYRPQGEIRAERA